MSAVVALTTLLVVELLRAFPALVSTRVDPGQRLPAWIQAVVLVAPFLAAATALPTLARRAPRRSLLWAATILAGARVVAQVVHGDVGALVSGVGLGGGLVVIGILAVTGLPLFGGGVLAGAGLAAVVRIAMGSRDLIWIDHPLAIAAVVGTAVWYVHLVRRRTRRDVVVLGRARHAALPLLSVGPALLLEAFVLTSLGWVAPALGHGWLAASTTIGLAAGAGVAAAALVAARPDGTLREVGLAGAVAVVGLGGALAWPGWGWAPIVVVAQAGVAVVLTAASARGVRSGSQRTALVGVASAPLVLLAAVVALDGRGALGIGIDPSVAITVSGLLLGAAAVAGSRLPAPESHQPGWRHVPSLAALFVLPAVVLLAGLPLLARAGGGAHVGDARELRIVTYNVALGFDGSGSLNLDGVVDVLASTSPDVVTLQEVPRGFLPGGGIDMLGFLQRSLDLPHLAFQPARSGALHGNAILSRYPIRGVGVRPFPSAEGTALPRGALAATIDVPVGDDVLVVAAHLPPGGDSEARAARVEAILDLWDGRPRTVVGLDANAIETSRTMRALTAAGLVVPEDGEPTFPSSDPLSRIDFVLHTADLDVIASEVPSSRASDHLPVLVVVRPSGLV